MTAHGHDHAAPLAEISPHAGHCIVEWFAPDGDLKAGRQALKEMLLELDDNVAHRRVLRGRVDSRKGQTVSDLHGFQPLGVTHLTDSVRADQTPRIEWMADSGFVVWPSVPGCQVVAKDDTGNADILVHARGRIKPGAKKDQRSNPLTLDQQSVGPTGRRAAADVERHNPFRVLVWPVSWIFIHAIDVITKSFEHRDLSGEPGVLVDEYRPACGRRLQAAALYRV